MPFGMGPAGWFMVPYFYPNSLGIFNPGGYNYFDPYWYGMPYGNYDELSYLKQMRQNLESQLQNINARIQTLEKQ